MRRAQAEMPVLRWERGSSKIPRQRPLCYDRKRFPKQWGLDRVEGGFCLWVPPVSWEERAGRERRESGWEVLELFLQGGQGPRGGCALPATEPPRILFLRMGLWTRDTDEDAKVQSGKVTDPRTPDQGWQGRPNSDQNLSPANAAPPGALGEKAFLKTQL